MRYVIEQPTYGLLEDALRYLGATCRPFARAAKTPATRSIPTPCARAITPATKLIVVTNLHNPSSVLTPESVLREIGDIARCRRRARAGGRGLSGRGVREYAARPRFTWGREFVVTSSLTKMYGVSGLRCGWILAEPTLARAMWRMNDVMAATPGAPGRTAERRGASRTWTRVRDRSRRSWRRTVKLLDEFLDRDARRSSAARTEWGTTCVSPAVARRCRRVRRPPPCRARYFRGRRVYSFGEPAYFRIGMGVDSEMFAEGLRRLSLHLRDHIQ